MATEKSYPGDEVLAGLYDGRKLSFRQIGEHLGVSAQTASKWVRRSGVELRSPEESRALAMGFPRPDRDVLVQLHIEEKLTCNEMGDRIGVSGACIHRWMVALEIPVRSVSEARYLAKKSVHSEETKERMRGRAAAMRERVTDESRARQAEKMRGREPPNKGKPMSEEQRQRMVEMWSDPERRLAMSRRMSGPNSPNWRGGSKTEHERQIDTAEWRRTRKLVYARDNYTCQDCGVATLNARDAKKHPERKVQAHHIIPRRHGGTHEMSNLVTLCARCHTKRERKYKDALFA